MKRGKKPIPENEKRHRYQIYVKPEVYEQFDMYCRLEDKTPSQAVERFMTMYVKDRTRPPYLEKFIEHINSELKDTLEYESWLRDLRVELKEKLGALDEE